MKNLSFLISSIAILLIVACCGSEPELEPCSAQHVETVTKQVNTDRLQSADATPEDWLSYGKIIARIDLVL